MKRQLLHIGKKKEALSMSSNRLVSLFKLDMIKNIIANHPKVTTIPNTVQDIIAQAESVGEIWCELLSNELFDFYNRLKKDLAEEGIYPTADELFMIRKSDKTNGMLLLAHPEEIAFDFFKNRDLSIFNTLSDKNNENFWYKIADSQLFDRLMSNRGPDQAQRH